jgi:single-stranded DNA-binding protein
MVKVTADGFVNRLVVGERYHRFDLATSRKDKKTGTVEKTFFRVTVFNGPPPEEGSLVVVDGNLVVEKREKDGKLYTNLNILADSDGIRLKERNGGGEQKSEAPKAKTAPKVTAPKWDGDEEIPF